MTSPTPLAEALAARWPDLPVNEGLVQVVEAREVAHPDDLYLALAALEGEAPAVTLLEREVFLPVRERLARGSTADQANEAMQRVREKLLVASPERPAALEGYAGNGPLKAWVTVVAAHQLSALRTPATPDLDEVQHLVAAASDDLELELVRARYADVFRAAVQAAFESLERRQRLVLRMAVVDGLSSQKIAAIFHTHRATVARWLQDAREQLRERTLSRVQSEAGLQGPELSSIARLVQRHTDFSVRRLLKGTPAE